MKAAREGTAAREKKRGAKSAPRCHVWGQLLTKPYKAQAIAGRRWVRGPLAEHVVLDSYQPGVAWAAPANHDGPVFHILGAALTAVDPFTERKPPACD
jgi:hypothetical protein